MFELILTATLFLLGLIFGTWTERRHFASLKVREHALRNILVFNEKLPTDVPEWQSGGILVTGSMVVSEDYFKRIAASLKSLVGGRLTVYESLLDRGRREAIVRMKLQAQQLGAAAICNVRIETSSLNDKQRNTLICCEVMAYGSAVGLDPRRAAVVRATQAQALALSR